MKKIVTSHKALLTAAICFATLVTNAMAGHNQNQCDVVSLSGTGRMLENGMIVGDEILSIMGKGNKFAVNFTAVTLGAIKLDQTTGAVTLAASHDFKSGKYRMMNFTTFDELTIIPLNGTDTNCRQNACGLIFKLKLKTGNGKYNCGEIVSGFNPDPTSPIPFTSFVNPFTPAPNGDTIVLNSMGKLCKCSGNN